MICMSFLNPPLTYSFFIRYARGRKLKWSIVRIGEEHGDGTSASYLAVLDPINGMRSPSDGEVRDVLIDLGGSLSFDRKMASATHIDIDLIEGGCDD